MAPITSFSQLDPNGSYTYADYLTWKFSEFVELIKGKVLRPMSAPVPIHQQYLVNLTSEIHQFLKRQPCRVYAAPFYVRLTRNLEGSDTQITTVVQPDICVVCDLTKIDKRGCLGAPDFIIEIVSSGNIHHDIKTKLNLYEEAGVLEYWVVFPGEKMVLAHQLDENGRYQVAAEYAEPGPMPVAVLPGLATEWSEIFEEQA